MPKTQWTCAGLLLLVALVLRAYFCFSDHSLWGVDGGAYILSALRTTGHEATHTDFIRPPLAPGLLLSPLISWFGYDLALKIFSYLAYLLIVPAYYFFAKRFLSGWALVTAIGFFLFDWMLAEMWIAGDLPMLGLSVLLLLLLALWPREAAKNDRLRNQEKLLLLGAPTMIALLNQTSTGIAFVLIVMILLFLWRADRKRLIQILPWLIAGGFIALIVCWRWYVSVLPGSGYTRYPGPLVAVYSAPNSAWEQMAWGGLTALWLICRRSNTLRALGFLLLAVSALGVCVSFDESIMNIFYRSRYLIAPLAYIGGVKFAATYAGWFFRKAQKWQYPVLTAGGVLSLLILIAGWFYQVEVERVLDRMVTPQMDQAITYIRLHPITNPDNRNQTVVTNSYSLSLYVAAITQHKTAWSQVYSPPPKYVQPHADAICMFGWNPGCDVRAAIERQHAGYLLIETAWPSHGRQEIGAMEGMPNLYDNMKHFAYRPDTMGYIWGNPYPPGVDPWTQLTNEPWLKKVFSAGTTRVYLIQ